MRVAVEFPRQRQPSTPPWPWPWPWTHMEPIRNVGSLTHSGSDPITGGVVQEFKETKCSLHFLPVSFFYKKYISFLNSSYI